VRPGLISALAGGLAAVAGPAGAFPMAGLPSGPPELNVSAEVAFDGIPPTGYVPVRLQISNGLSRPLSFELRAACDSSMYRGGVRRDVRVLRVEAQAVLTEAVLMPLAPLVKSGYASWSTCNLELVGGPAGIRSFAVSGRIPGPNDSDRPTIGFSHQLPDPTERLAGAVPGEVHVVKVDLGLLPGDWRALAGLDALWLLPEDAHRLVPEVRSAVLHWVAHGGELVVVVPPEDDHLPLLPLAGLPFTEADLDAGRFGLGRLSVVRASETSDDLDGLMSSLRARVVASGHPRRGHAALAPGEVEQQAGKVEVRRPLIVAFLIGFMLLVGPVNFLLLAPRAQRMRLLVSTPALGLAASAGLMGVILLQDGVGGEGQRAQVILHMPRINLEVRGQVQSSRTGLVAGSSFELPEALDLAALPEEQEQGRELTREGTRASGDWFRTRAVQAQWLEDVAPGRGRVELAPSSGPGAPPTVVSSLGAPLSRFFYTDLEGKTWAGEGLAPGATVTLTAVDGTPAWLGPALERFPGPARKALQARLPGPGWLVGQATEGVPPWPTLGSVRFEDAAALVAVEVSTQGGAR
jgi:hypothetical protein